MAVCIVCPRSCSSGNHLESLAALEPRFGVRKGQPFAQAKLDADVSAIEDFYRRQGFAAVRVESSVEPVPTAAGTEVPVVVRLAITEGVRTVVGLGPHARATRPCPKPSWCAGLGLQPGKPFFPTQMAIDRDAIQLQYANRGYQSTTITSNPGISADGGLADVVFTVSEGPRLIVDHVLIVGNVRTKTETIERELQIKAGDPLGLAAVVESQRRLAELGLFRRVRITQVPHGDESPPRSRRHHRGIPGHDGWLWRRYRSAAAGSDRCRHRRCGRTSGVRSAGVFRGRPEKPIRQEPIDQPVRAHQPEAGSCAVDDRHANSSSVSIVCSAPFASRGCSAPRPTHS